MAALADIFSRTAIDPLLTSNKPWGPAPPAPLPPLQSLATPFQPVSPIDPATERLGGGAATYDDQGRSLTADLLGKAVSVDPVERNLKALVGAEPPDPNMPDWMKALQFASQFEAGMPMVGMARGPRLLYSRNVPPAKTAILPDAALLKRPELDWHARIADLDAHNAPDEAYRNILSAGAKEMRANGAPRDAPSWRDKIVGFLHKASKEDPQPTATPMVAGGGQGLADAFQNVVTLPHDAGGGAASAPMREAGLGIFGGAKKEMPSILGHHGTRSVFDTFDAADRGVWFAEEEALAKQYADSAFGQGQPRVISAHLSPQKPLVIPEDVDLMRQMPVQDALDLINADNGTKFTADDIFYRPDEEVIPGEWIGGAKSGNFIDAVKKAGFDGISAYEEGQPIWNVFDPAQIKGR